MGAAFSNPQSQRADRPGVATLRVYRSRSPEAQRREGLSPLRSRRGTFALFRAAFYSKVIAPAYQGLAPWLLTQAPFRADPRERAGEQERVFSALEIVNGVALTGCKRSFEGGDDLRISPYPPLWQGEKLNAAHAAA